MATPVIMPRQGQSVESCIIGKWHKKKGHPVKEGDILFTYETDKATFEEESKVSGNMLEIYFQEGDDVPVLTNVCVIGHEGEDIGSFNPIAKKNGEESGPLIVTDIPVSSVNMVKPETSAKSNQINPDEPLKISPRARILANARHIDYRHSLPTGPNGRIIERDIQALENSGHVFTSAAWSFIDQIENFYTGTGLGGRITTEDITNSPKSTNTGDIDSAAIAPDLMEPMFEDKKIPHIRKVIAKAMHTSLSSTAQLTLNTSFDASSMLEYRSIIKNNKDILGLENITINDMIIYAVSRTLLNHKDLNAHFLDDTMRYFTNTHIGVAIDTDRGLMVPTIINANLKSLNAISAEVKSLAKECYAGTINPDKLKNGSFTITNLGTLDIESFTPILNPPQTGILGVNNIVQKAREVNGQCKFYPSMSLSLTFDHRGLDGAPAARFLKELKVNLEKFTILLAR